MGSKHSFCLVLGEDGSQMLLARYPVRVNASEDKPGEVGQRLYDIAKASLSSLPGTWSLEAFFQHGGCLCAGVTGIKPGEPVISEIWRSIEFPEESCWMTGDAEVLLPGSTGQMNGAVVVAHAGSVAYARGPGGSHRVGGWGPLLGDEGSGYYFGRKALHALTWHKDDYKEKCPELVDRVRKCLFESRERWGDAWRKVVDDHSLGSDAGERGDDDWLYCLIPYVRAMIHQGWWRYALSQLAGAVVEAAEQERRNGKRDEKAVASRIMERGIQHIAARLEKAVTKAGLSGTQFHIVLAGGVLVHQKPVRDRLIEAIRTAPGDIYRSAHTLLSLLPKTDGVYHTGAGAALHALQASLHELPEAETCRRIREEAETRVQEKYPPQQL